MVDDALSAREIVYRFAFCKCSEMPAARVVHGCLILTRHYVVAYLKTSALFARPFSRRSLFHLPNSSQTAAGKTEEEVGESDEPDLTASADLEDSR